MSLSVPRSASWSANTGAAEWSQSGGIYSTSPRESTASSFRPSLSSECDSSSESEDTKHARCEDISSEHSTDDDWSEPEEVCENKGAVTSVHGEEHVVGEEDGVERAEAR